MLFRDAGTGTQQIAAAGQAKHLFIAAAELLGDSIGPHLAGAVSAVRMGMQEAEHHHAAADSAAELFVASAHAAAEAAGHSHHGLLGKSQQIRESARHRLGAVISLMMQFQCLCTTIHCLFLLL